MPNPIEDMTEEQKEYEAQKLANMIGELSRWELKSTGPISTLVNADLVQLVLVLDSSLLFWQIHAKEGR